MTDEIIPDQLALLKQVEKCIKRIRYMMLFYAIEPTGVMFMQMYSIMDVIMSAHNSMMDKTDMREALASLYQVEKTLDVYRVNFIHGMDI